MQSREAKTTNWRLPGMYSMAESVKHEAGKKRNKCTLQNIQFFPEKVCILKLGIQKVYGMYRMEESVKHEAGKKRNKCTLQSIQFFPEKVCILKLGIQKENILKSTKKWTIPASIQGASHYKSVLIPLGHAVFGIRVTSTFEIYLYKISSEVCMRNVPRV